MTMRRKCRVWWPKQLSSSEPPSACILFGWFVSSSLTSLDIVVAFAWNELSLSHSQSDLEVIIHDTNGNMPVFLQHKSVFSVLGHWAADRSSNNKFLNVGMEDSYGRKSSSCGNACVQNGQDRIGENDGLCNCGCHRLEGLLEQCRQTSIGSNNWMQLVDNSYEQYGSEILWIPQLHHIHWNGHIVSQCDVHVIIYETPTYGAHHFSLSSWNSLEQVQNPLEKPKWVDELHQKQPLIDLDTVILAINSVAAAKIFFERHLGPSRYIFRVSVTCMFFGFLWKLFAMFMASLSTLFYIVLQLLHGLLSYGSHLWIYIRLAKVFSTTWINIRIRCCQILYWPIFLNNNGCRSHSCVEYAEKAALHKHSMWSSLAVDILLGNLIGLALLCHAECACVWVLNFASDITNSLLRSGCVWLMGVPAGFKLNTELAGVLGMISLNAIQIWSTLWIFVGSLFIYTIKGLAVLGILFGFTTPAALIIDIIMLATLHVSTLHWLMSLLYSMQIQALAALWRLFGGRKWNPLRLRLDSYEYTVKQHIVGSLLFTLLLLLLPTTSVFYMFFTIMNTTVSVFCIAIEVTISLIHATPYTKVFLWLERQRRYPSGIWFEILSCQSNAVDFGSQSENSLSQKDTSGKKSSILVLFLHSNFLSIGQIISPHYRNLFSGASSSRSFLATSAYGLLTGKIVASRLGTGLPPVLPWMSIPYKDYWCVCRDSILKCRKF